MLKHRLAAVQAVRAEFLPAEQATENSVVFGARCIATMVEQRAAAGLPLTIGLDELDLMLEAVKAAVAARRAMLTAHVAMAKLPGQIGIRAFGPDCPEMAMQVPGDDVSRVMA